jgi:hypothetical protein
MGWIQSHEIVLLSTWMLLHMSALQLSSVYPPTSRFGKLVHVWCALNPLDFVKAFRTAMAAPTADTVAK